MSSHRGKGDRPINTSHLSLFIEPLRVQNKINQGLLPLKPNITEQAEHEPDVNLGQKAKTERQAPNAKAELSPLNTLGLISLLASSELKH